MIRRMPANFSILSLLVLALTVLLSPAPAEAAQKKPPYVLGIGWQNAYCETKAKRPECQGEGEGALFSLQGLWVPGERFCHVADTDRQRDAARDWLGLPAVALPPALDQRLKTAMPGAVSGLDRHVWLMNGTCQSRTPADYFALQLRLLDEVNGSAVARLFKARIGQSVDRAAVTAAFAESFGPDSASRVKMRCRKIGGRQLVTGLTIGLGGELDKAPLKEAIDAAPATRFGCESGIVDAAGSTPKSR